MKKIIELNCTTIVTKKRPFTGTFKKYKNIIYIDKYKAGYQEEYKESKGDANCESGYLDMIHFIFIEGCHYKKYIVSETWYIENDQQTVWYFKEQKGKRDETK